MKATIGVDFKRKIITVKGTHNEISLELNIWDFGGEEKIRNSILLPSVIEKYRN
jgi:GTPase SAR1 family protein